ncbi:hypothetical protein HPP92_028928 [Vanilla planifolia]|uniref:Uncharacterized protein n=1 Tax=Vanilla planifolia TaxID=51239 RepID=A0A835U1R8_VANPL|nr:hypothetical protein HPP92_028928 [Vanilla planifolia]KAG0446259.1 hypothetical protein HPP92_028918 [Vanilla planifolia]
MLVYAGFVLVTSSPANACGIPRCRHFGVSSPRFECPAWFLPAARWWLCFLVAYSPPAYWYWLCLMAAGWHHWPYYQLVLPIGCCLRRININAILIDPAQPYSSE